MRAASLIAVAVAIVLVLAGAVGVYAYDRSRQDRVAEGVDVAGVDVGGLDRDAARARLERELAQPLAAPVVVRARGERFRLSAEQAGVEVDLDGAVDEAIRRSREGTVLARAYRGLTGGELDASVQPGVSYSDGAVDELVARVRRQVERAPRDATVEFATAGLEKVDGREGLKIRAAQLRERVGNALLRRSDRTVRASIARTQPKVTTKELADRYDTVVTVDRANFRLRLFKRLSLVKTYPIALGRIGQETPAGLYAIANKVVNPSWNVPDSDWAGELAGRVIPPGPDNPLKARWLGVYDGVGIHGTAERDSIGTNASRGCIRMLIEDVVELYERVPVGAAIYIS